MATSVMTAADLQRLLDLLVEQGYEVVGPTVRDGAVVLDQLHRVEELPVGMRETQDGGRYRLEPSGADTLFAYTLGPHSWKKYVHPPQQHFLQARPAGRSFTVEGEAQTPPPRAFLGVRACELSALSILDKVLVEGPHVAAANRRLRRRTLVIAVNCTMPGGTCFCVSMGTGPRVRGGYDILLTELAGDSGPMLLAESGSERGGQLLESLSLAEADDAQVAERDAALERAAEGMGRTLDTSRLPEILRQLLDNRRWEEIAERCLNCGNCTMVCPTCFCGTTVDTTDLTGQAADRTFLWDSCHTVDFSYIHGGSIRSGSHARYRQWLMHKMAYWPEQFGTLGCVGCGRCITWCPVGIDITEEATKLRELVSG